MAALVDGSLLGVSAEVVDLEPLDVRAVSAILRDRGLPPPLVAPLSPARTRPDLRPPLGRGRPCFPWRAVAQPNRRNDSVKRRRDEARRGAHVLVAQSFSGARRYVRA